MSTFGQVIGRLLNYGTQVALARMYGPAALGIYVLGITLTQMATILGQLGMDHGVMRYVAHYRAEGNDSRLRGTMLLGAGTVFALGLVLTVFMFFGAGYLANNVFNKPLLETGIRIVSVSIPFFSVMLVAGFATQGFQTVRYATYVQYIQRPLLNLLLIGGFYLLGLHIFSAFLAYTLSAIVGFALALYYLQRTYPKLLDGNTPPTYETRALFGLSLPMIAYNVVNNLNPWIAVTAVGIFASSSAVGVFNAAVRTATLVSMMLELFTIFWSMIANLYARDRLEDLRVLYQDVSRWTFTGAIAIFLVVVLLAEDVMAVFGPKFASGWVVLIVIAVGQLFSAAAGTTTRLLSMTGNQNMAMIATIGSAATSALASVTLIPAYGILGAGLGMAAGIVFQNIVMLFFIRRRLDMLPYNRGYLKPLVAGIVVFASAYVVKAMISPPTGVLTVLIFAPLFLVGFVLLLLLFGLSPSDRQFLIALWAAIRRAGPRGAD
jgi:O-antigen/teichoic acid export membrane protein